MLALTPQLRILVAVKAVDFRKGIDGLAAVCRQELQADPLSGCVFVFRNRRRTAIKVLVYDGQGFWLCQKRLSAGRFPYWLSGEQGRVVEAQQLQVLLSGGNPDAAGGVVPWRRVSMC